jgi:trans-aconitate methyltransferase
VTDRPAVRRGPEREPVEIDTTVAHEARVYDYLLGGTVHFDADREAAQRAAAAVGGLDVARASVQANRAFLGEAVRFLVEEGIGQFLDVGTGIPGPGHVHRVAGEAVPDARIVYVDNDPIVLAHAHALLDGDHDGATAYIEGDLRDPEDILARAATTLDLGAPVGVILGAVLHHLPDHEDPRGLVARLLDPLVPGSYLVASHLAGDLHTDEMAALSRSVPDDARYILGGRSRDDVARFFAGLTLLDPGVVPLDHWRRPGGPAPDGAARAWHYAAIGRKP